MTVKNIKDETSQSLMFMNGQMNLSIIMHLLNVPISINHI